MAANIVYEPQSHTAMLGNSIFTVISKNPIFATSEEKKCKKQEIQDSLYNIFSKYINA